MPVGCDIYLQRPFFGDGIVLDSIFYQQLQGHRRHCPVQVGRPDIKPELKPVVEPGLEYAYVIPDKFHLFRDCHCILVVPCQDISVHG